MWNEMLISLARQLRLTEGGAMLKNKHIVMNMDERLSKFERDMTESAVRRKIGKFGE